MKQKRKSFLTKDKKNTVYNLEKKLNKVKNQIDAIDEKIREIQQLTDELTIEQFKDKPKKDIEVRKV